MAADAEDAATGSFATDSAAAAAAAVEAAEVTGIANGRLVRNEGALGARNTSDGGAVVPRPRAVPPPPRVWRGRVRDDSVCTFDPMAVDEPTVHEAPPAVSRSAIDGRGSSLRMACKRGTDSNATVAARNRALCSTVANV